VTVFVEVDGATELRDTLRRFTNRPGAVFTKAYRQVAKMVETDARGSLDAIPAPSAGIDGLTSGIEAAARQSYAALTIRSTDTTPTIAAVLGANVHSVFGRKFPISEMDGDRPWLEHLGASWQPEDLYGVGDVLKSKTVDDVVDVFWEAFMEAITGLGGQVS
jgi:hypothetical protein